MIGEEGIVRHVSEYGIHTEDDLKKIINKYQSESVIDSKIYFYDSKKKKLDYEYSYLSLTINTDAKFELCVQFEQELSINKLSTSQKEINLEEIDQFIEKPVKVNTGIFGNMNTTYLMDYKIKKLTMIGMVNHTEWTFHLGSIKFTINKYITDGLTYFTLKIDNLYRKNHEQIRSTIENDIRLYPVSNLYREISYLYEIS